MQNPNFLILDEPANDLDIDTLNVLESFLVNYPGVLLLVSHDRYLLDRLTDQLFIFNGNGKITIYNGNYADYRNEQSAVAEQTKQQAMQKTSVSIPIQEEIKKKLSYRERLEYEALDKEIPLLEGQISEQTQALGNTIDHGQLATIAESIRQLNEELDAKIERWIELGEYM